MPPAALGWWWGKTECQLVEAAGLSTRWVSGQAYLNHTNRVRQQIVTTLFYEQSTSQALKGHSDH